MRAQVAKSARTCGVLVQPPDQREVWIHDPVLQIHRAPVVDFSQSPRFDQLFGKLNSRHTAVVKIDHADNARARYCIKHLASFGQRIGQRLLAKNVLAILRRLDRNGCVAVARCGNID